MIGILVVTAIGLPFGLAQFTGIISMPPSIAPTFLQLDFSRICELTFLIVVFSILFMDVFDNAGTLIGVTHRTGLMKNGKLARMKEALISDSFAAMFGALIGTSTTTSYIESAAGVSAGGRTGLTAAFVGLFFLLALFFAPLAGMIPAYASAAALLYVACVMARGLAEIDWEDITEYAPAVVTAITMPLTYSIATGIGLGFITLCACQADCRQNPGYGTSGGGLGGFVRGQICGRRMNLAASWQVWAVSVGDLCRADRHLREGWRRKRQCRFRDLHPHYHYPRDAGLHFARNGAIPVAGCDFLAQLSFSFFVGARDRCVLDLLFPRAQNRRGRQGRAHRQAFGGAGGDIRRNFSG